MFATTVQENMGWLPTYFRIFIPLAAFTGGLVVVNLRAQEPLHTNWYTFSLVTSILAALGSLPGIALCMTAEDVPAAFLGPFISLLLGAILLAYQAAANQHSRENSVD
ncbi:MAG: hypothetical protein KC912_01230 [Proteobacteria bacterium]|nr:hypothetical protein [Pseudomonadota bacterium]